MAASCSASLAAGAGVASSPASAISLPQPAPLGAVVGVVTAEVVLAEIGVDVVEGLAVVVLEAPPEVHATTKPRNRKDKRFMIRY